MMCGILNFMFRTYFFHGKIFLAHSEIGNIFKGAHLDEPIIVQILKILTLWDIFNYLLFFMD